MSSSLGISDLYSRYRSCPPPNIKIAQQTMPPFGTELEVGIESRKVYYQMMLMESGGWSGCLGAFFGTIPVKMMELQLSLSSYDT